MLSAGLRRGRIEYSTGGVEQMPRKRDNYLPEETALFRATHMRVRGGTPDAYG